MMVDTGILQISTDWTPEERLQVVGKIVCEMGRAIEQSSVDIEMLSDWRSRLSILARYSAWFLEANKDVVIGHST